MPKKVFAVTNVKIDQTPEGYFAAGEEVNPAKFTKEQLLELHAAGAIEVRVVDEEVAPDGTAVDSVVDETADTTSDGTPGDSAEHTDADATADS